MLEIKDFTSEEFKNLIQNNLGKYIGLYKDDCFIGGITLYDMNNYNDIVATYNKSYMMIHFNINRSYISLIVDGFEIQE